MVTWFAGLFYLPRLFVYHAMSQDKISHERFIVMEKKLFSIIMTPALIFTWVSGLTMTHYLGFDTWLILKLFFVKVFKEVAIGEYSSKEI